MLHKTLAPGLIFMPVNPYYYNALIAPAVLDLSITTVIIQNKKSHSQKKICCIQLME